MERGAERGGERGAAGVGGDVNRGGGGVMVEIGGGLAARERERREIRAGEAWAGMGEGVRLRGSILDDTSAPTFRNYDESKDPTDGLGRNQLEDDQGKNETSDATKSMEDKVPKVGMKFNSEQEAYDFYNAYAGEKVAKGNQIMASKPKGIELKRKEICGSARPIGGLEKSSQNGKKKKNDDSPAEVVELQPVTEMQPQPYATVLGNLEVPNDQAFLHVSQSAF
uniref:Protein FAR1-RELATED SEQUENCE n=1 Tax=Oryza rufipogon TaxID=4529 RepID=A0A0E0QG94_ORYRU